MPELAGLLVFMGVLGVMVGALASRKNRDAIGWGLFGAVATVPALIAIAFMSYLCPRCKGPITNQEKQTGRCPRCDAERLPSPPVIRPSQKNDSSAPDEDLATVRERALGTLAKGAAARQAKGAELAEDCYENGLLKNEIVKLSDMENVIHENFSYDPTSVSTGFMLRMKQYMDSGDVVSLSLEGGDVVFVHEKFAQQFIDRMKGFK